MIFPFLIFFVSFQKISNDFLLDVKNSFLCKMFFFVSVKILLNRSIVFKNWFFFLVVHLNDNGDNKCPNGYCLKLKSFFLFFFSKKKCLNVFVCTKCVVLLILCLFGAFSVDPFSTYHAQLAVRVIASVAAEVYVFDQAVACIRDPLVLVWCTKGWPHVIYSLLEHALFRAAMEFCLSNFRKDFSTRYDVAFPCHCANFAFLSFPILR